MIVLGVLTNMEGYEKVMFVPQNFLVQFSYNLPVKVPSTRKREVPSSCMYSKPNNLFHYTGPFELLSKR